MNLPLTVVGLTGGIASGKSLVAGFLREEGVPVLDADSVGRLVLETGTQAYKDVVEAFGPDILAEDGSIDRQKLGERIFGDPERRKTLESITHPAISAMARRALELVAERGEPWAVYEAALLVETGAHRGMAALVVVSCPVAMQMERLCARDGLSREEAARRIAAQLPLPDKIAAADYVIDNSGDVERTRTRTLEVLADLRRRFGEKS